MCDDYWDEFDDTFYDFDADFDADFEENLLDECACDSDTEHTGDHPENEEQSKLDLNGAIIFGSMILGNAYEDSLDEKRKLRQVHNK
jgi:hypothetical protein